MVKVQWSLPKPSDNFRVLAVTMDSCHLEKEGAYLMVKNHAYMEKKEKIRLGETRFTVIHLIPKMPEDVRESRKKELGNELYSIFKKYADSSFID